MARKDLKERLEKIKSKLERLGSVKEEKSIMDRVVDKFLQLLAENVERIDRDYNLVKEAIKKEFEYEGLDVVEDIVDNFDYKGFYKRVKEKLEKC